MKLSEEKNERGNGKVMRHSENTERGREISRGTRSKKRRNREWW